MQVQEQVISIIKNSLVELNKDIQENELNKPTAETCLFGADGLLDSLNIVRLIVDVEEKVLDKFGIEIAIADENAMSQKRSPFRTVQSLADYINVLIQEESDE